MLVTVFVKNSANDINNTNRNLTGGILISSDFVYFKYVLPLQG
jgi:hypothetical protein